MGTQIHSTLATKYFKIDDSVIDTLDPMAVIEPLWESVDIYNTHEEYEKWLKPLSLSLRSVFSIMWLIGEVFNGGLYQFYTNATGIVWEDAMKGFDLIGVPEAH